MMPQRGGPGSSFGASLSPEGRFSMAADSGGRRQSRSFHRWASAGKRPPALPQLGSGWRGGDASSSDEARRRFHLQARGDRPRIPLGAWRCDRLPEHADAVLIVSDRSTLPGPFGSARGPKARVRPAIRSSPPSRLWAKDQHPRRLRNFRRVRRSPVSVTRRLVPGFQRGTATSSGDLVRRAGGTNGIRFPAARDGRFFRAEEPSARTAPPGHGRGLRS